MIDLKLSRKKHRLFIGLIFFSLFLLCFGSQFALADNTNTPSDGNTNDNTSGGKQVSSFPEYMKFIVDFLMAAVGILAMFMIVFGGYQYMISSGNAEAAANAKDRIVSALIGLILVLLSFLILQRINPDLLEFKLDVAEVNLGGNDNRTTDKSCTSDADCASLGKDYYCNEDKLCREGNKGGWPNGTVCGDENSRNDSKCLSGICGPVGLGEDPNPRYRTCINPQESNDQAYCDRPEECKSGLCAFNERNMRGKSCMDPYSKTNDESCRDNIECKSHVCNDAYITGRYCADPKGKGKGPCNDENECQTGLICRTYNWLNKCNVKIPIGSDDDCKRPIECESDQCLANHKCYNPNP